MQNSELRRIVKFARRNLAESVSLLKTYYTWDQLSEIFNVKRCYKTKQKRATVK